MKKLSLLMMAILCHVFSSYAQGDFITEWANNQSGSNLVVEIAVNPDNNLSYNYDVDWGDGTTDQNVTGSITHNYSSGSNHTVSISGDFPAIFMRNSSTSENLVDITQWGADINWESMAFAFANCNNLGYVSATDDPNLDMVADMSYMFHRCLKMEGQFNTWNVETVRYMRGTFSGAETFDGELDEWNVSSVSDMTSMFENTLKFNHDISGWETDALEEISYMFAGAAVFNQYVGDWNTEMVRVMDGIFSNAKAYNQNLNWNTESVTSMHNLFSNAVSFNQDISELDFSSVENMSHMLEGAQSFDQDLSTWSIGSIKDMSYMLSGSGMSSCNYEATLAGWMNAGTNGIVLGADGLSYYQTSSRNDLVYNQSWTIKGDLRSATDLCVPAPVCGEDPSTFFKTSWTVTAGQTITIPINSGGYTYNFDVDWDGDGVFDLLNQTGSVTSPAYVNAGTYQVSIRGDFPAIQMGSLSQNEKNKLTSIDQWGCIKWEDFKSAFDGCSNLTYAATDVPDMGNCSNLERMFAYTPVNASLNNWDVSSITKMRGMFFGSDFNGNISSWNVSNVTDMAFMFSDASSFNQPIDNWDVANVINMTSMFGSASNFNQPINNWDVSSLVIAQAMFANASSFNQPLNNWNVSNVSNMYNMFSDALSFNQPLNNWDVSAVLYMHYMFEGASDFNQSLNSWDVSSVINMAYMFEDAISFNQSVNNWNVANVTLMNEMFHGANNFNQSLSSWDVSSVTNMRNMFSGASNFSQSLNNWDLNSVTSFSPPLNGSLVGMLDNSGMSQTNYESTLDGWAANVNTPSNLTIGSAGLTYCEPPHTGRSTLVNSKGWTFYGDADVCSPSPNLGGSNSNGGVIINQSSGLMNINQISATNAKVLGVKLFNINGQVVYQSTSSDDTTIDTSNLSTGVYLLQLETTNGIEAKKVVVE